VAMHVLLLIRTLVSARHLSLLMTPTDAQLKERRPWTFIQLIEFCSQESGMYRLGWLITSGTPRESTPASYRDGAAGSMLAPHNSKTKASN
jgi:hypothetical protein